MKQLTVGFVFDETLTKVLLVHKQKPDWQVGKLNGMGGKVEDNESPTECMSRECLEETCLDIAVDAWTKFATIKEEEGGRDKAVDFFAASFSGPLTDARKGDYEEVEWFTHNQLPDNCIQNLYFLIPMARETLRGHSAKKITIEY